MTGGVTGQVIFHDGKTKSKSMTGQGDDIIHHQSSQMAYKFANLGRIERNGLVHQIQENKGVLTVPALLLFGHRRHAGDLTEQRRTVAHDAEMI
jgi:hypothetical protein